MDDTLFDKITTAVRIILYQQLKENCDDTFSHKLVDTIKWLTQEKSLSRDMSTILLHIVRKAIDDHLAGQLVDLVTAIKLLGLLVKSLVTLDTNSSIFDECIKYLKKLLDGLTDQPNSQYNLQCAYLICLSDLATTPEGGISLCKDNALMSSVFFLLRESKGHYVQLQAKKFFIDLFSGCERWDDSVIGQLGPFVNHALLLQKESDFNTISILVQHEQTVKFLEEKYQLSANLFKKYNQVQPLFLMHYCKIFGRVVMCEKDINYIAADLVKKRLVRPLISLFSCYRMEEFPREAFVFLLGPVVGLELLPNDVFIDQLAKSQIEELFSTIKLSDQMFALQMLKIRITNLKSFGPDVVCTNALQEFVLQFGSEKPFKLIMEILLIIKDILTRTVNLEGGRTIFLKTPRLITVEDKRIATLALGILRDALDTLAYTDYDEAVFSLIRESISKAMEISDFDFIASSLEVVSSISRRVDFVHNQNLVLILITVWNRCKVDYLNSAAMQSLIPLMLIIQVKLSFDELRKYGFERDEEILRTISFFLKSTDSLKESCLTALRDFFQLNGNMEKFVIPFWQILGPPLSQIAIEEIDHEILSSIFKIWHGAVSVQLSASNNSLDNLKAMYESGLFQSLNMVLNDRYLLPETKSCASVVLKSVRSLFDHFLMDKDSLRQLFLGCKQPNLRIIETCSGGEGDQLVERDEVFNEIFGDSEVVPTQDLINHLISRKTLEESVVKMEKDLPKISVDDLTDFLQNFTFKEEAADDWGEYHCLLNDILLAKDYKCTIPSDCY